MKTAWHLSFVPGAGTGHRKLATVAEVVILFLFVALYVWNVSTKFWCLPSPSDPLQYLGSTAWKTTWAYWPWLDRLALAVGLRVFAMLLPNNIPVAGMAFVGFVHVALLLTSMLWGYRKSGFFASLLVGVFFNASFLLLGWATYLYPDAPVALYSLLAFVFFFSKGPSKEVWWPTICAGVFTAFACWSKATGIGTLGFFMAYLLYYRHWSSVKAFILGLFLGSVFVCGAYTLLYNYQSFLQSVNDFVGSGLQRNVYLLNRRNLVAYFDVVLALKYFPFIALIVAAGAYRNKASRNLLWLALSNLVIMVFFIGLLTMRGGAPIPNYLYTGQVCVILALSIHLSDLLQGDGKPGTTVTWTSSTIFKVILGLSALVLLTAGLTTGITFSPIGSSNYSYDYNYYETPGIFLGTSEDNALQWPFYVKAIYILGPVLALGLLALIEASKSKVAICALVLVAAIWSSTFNGGLAYQKATFDRSEAGPYYRWAPILNEVPADKFSVYVTELNDSLGDPQSILWVYRLFFDEKYPRGDEFDAQYKNDLVIAGSIKIIEKESDLVFALGDQILTDDPQAVNKYQLGWITIKEFDWEGVSLSVLQLIPEPEFRGMWEELKEEAILDLDRSASIVSEGHDKYLVARTGQRVTVEGTPDQVAGPWEGWPALYLGEATTNLVTNPSFELDLTGWSPTAGHMQRLDVQSRYGTYSAVFDPAGPNDRVTYDCTSTTSALSLYAWSVRVWAARTGGDTIRLGFYDADGGDQYQDFSVPRGRWTEIALIRSFGGASSRYVYVGSGTGSDFYLDGAQLEMSPYVTPYCDGDPGGHGVWNGTPRASTSACQGNMLSFPRFGSLDHSGPHTVVVWYRLESWPWIGSPTPRAIFTYGGHDTDNSIALLQWIGTDSASVVLQVKDSLGNRDILGVMPGDYVVADDWHLVGYSYDGRENVNLFLDDWAKAGTVIGWPDGLNANDTIYLGPYDDGTHALGGTLAGVMIFDRALSAAEVDVLYLASLGPGRAPD